MADPLRCAHLYISPVFLSPSPSLFFMSYLKIISLNVRGLRDDSKRIHVFHHLRSFDVCFLQETHCASADDARSWAQLWGGQCVFTTFSPLSAGCAILIHRRCGFRAETPFFSDPSGRVACMAGSLYANTAAAMRVFLCCVYAPFVPHERVLFFERLSDLPCFAAGADWVDRAIFLGGDFNCIEDASLDKVGGNPTQGTSGMSLLTAFLRGMALHDPFRHHHPDLPSFTWRSPDGAVATRIDRLYVSGDLVARTDVTHVPFALSDHCAVEAVVDLSGTERGPGYWKLNTALLKNPFYVFHMRNVLRQWRSDRDHYASPLLHWDALKTRVRSVSRAFASTTKELLSIQHDSAQRAHAAAATAWTASPTAARAAELDEATQELHRLQSAALEGSVIRSRVKWMLEGERPTRYFLGLEKSRAASSTFAAVRCRDGSVATAGPLMADAAADFYQELYTPESDVHPGALEHILRHVPSLPPDVAAPLGAPLSLEELSVALRKSPRGRAPGADGLPVEFYEAFWDILGPELLRVALYALEHGLPLPVGSRSSVLSLLYKKGDRADLANWRPIALMCADVKLLSRVLVERLKPVMGLLVHRDQAGFVDGRSIHDHILSAQMAIDFCDSTGVGGAVFLVDQAKAFDRVHWAYRDAVLARMGLPPAFVEMVHLLHRDISAAVLVNGFLSRNFHIRRGTRQGDPLSPLLFALVDEPFACALRASPLHGLPTPGRPLRLQQFADDKLIGLANARDVRVALRLFALYEHASGARINPAKSELVLLRASRDDPAFGSIEARVILPGSSTRYLGVQIGSQLSNEAVWQAPVDDFNETLAAWRGRDLSYSGRVTVLRALAASKLWFTAAVCTPSPAVVATLTASAFKFLWRAPHGLVSRDVATATKAQGGLDMPDLSATLCAFALRPLLKLVALARLPVADRPLWSLVLEHRLASVPGIFALGDSLPALLLNNASLRRLRALMPDSLRHVADALFAVRALRPERKPPDDVALSLLQAKSSVSRKQVLTGCAPTGAVARTLAAHRRELPDFVSRWRDDTGVQELPSVNQVFRGVWHRARPRRECDILWRGVHDRLPVGARIYHFAGRLFCTVCTDEVETTHHLFFACRVASDVWASLEGILSAYVGSPIKINAASALLGVKPRVKRGSSLPPSVWHCAHSSVYSAIWQLRCRASISNRPELFTAIATLSLAKAKLARVLATSSLFKSVDINKFKSLL